MENNANGGNAQLRATVTITRKATGAQETYTIVGTPVSEQASFSGALGAQPAEQADSQQPKE